MTCREMDPRRARPVVIPQRVSFSAVSNID